MSLSVDQFGKAIVSSGLMSADEVKAIWAELPTGRRPKDGKTFAKLLLESQKLNEFQARELLSGSNIPLVLNQYVLLKEIGAGGMGQVFQAQHRKMKRFAAIKLLKLSLVKDEAAVKRFLREVEAAAKLSHPNIVQTYDADECRGIHFLAMEYVDGKDLAAVANQRGKLPVADAVNYAMQASHGLAFAHSKGIVHRDIKPANLLLDNEGVVKILDMGLARIDGAAAGAQEGLTQSGQVLGTVDYMSPEQAFDTCRVDARADIYSLGCTLYRLLTTQNMYEGDSLLQKLMGHRNKPIPKLALHRPDILPALVSIFERMVAKDPNDRFQSMAEVESALASLDIPPSPSKDSSTSENYAVTAQFNRLAGVQTIVVEPTIDVVTAPYSQHHQSSELEQTVSLKDPKQDTDPVSEQSIQLVQRNTPLAGISKRPPGRRRKLFVAAGGLGAVLLLLGIWIIIKDKDGKEVARIELPVGGTATVVAQPAESARPFTLALGAEANVLGAAPVSNTHWPFDPPDGREYTWSEPENLGSGVNTTKTEYIAAISPDELSLFFYSGRKHYFARRSQVSVPFTNPVELFDFSDRASVSANGLAMAIAKNKQLEQLWLSERRDINVPFPSPKLASALINGDHSTLHPIFSADGLSLLVTTNRNGTRRADVWSFTRSALDQPFISGESLGDVVNTPDWDMPYFISNDRCFLIASNQKRVAGQELRYVRYFTRAKSSEPFQPGRALGIPLGQAEDSDKNADFQLSGDGRAIYFTTSDLPQSIGGHDMWVTRRIPKEPSHVGIAAHTLLIEPQLTRLAETAGSATTTASVIDLLPLIDVKSDVVSGNWLFTPNGLMVSITKGAKNDVEGSARLQLPYTPPQEYDFEIEFTPTAGNFRITQRFSVVGRAIAWEFDSKPSTATQFSSGFSRLDGHSVSASSESLKTDGPMLVNGTRYRARIEVRNKSLRVILDDKELKNWQGDFARFADLGSRAELPDKHRLGLICFSRAVTFHRITVLEVTGRGELSRATSPVDPAHERKTAP